MASGALFGSTRSQSKNLLEFRAGKMTLNSSDKIVYPDKRKGLIYIFQSEDGLMHFCWKDRTSNKPEDDLIIFPDDTVFRKVPQCKTGRVFLLKFKSSTRKLFFWVQEPKADKDEDNCKKVNELLNHPPPQMGSRGGTGNGGLPSDVADPELSNILGGMNQQQLIQLLGMGGGPNSSNLNAIIGRPGSGQTTSESTTPSRVQSSPGPRSGTADSAQVGARPATAATAPSTEGSDQRAQRIQLSDLQSMLTDMAPAGQSVDISTALTPDALIPLLSNPAHREALLPHLPEAESLPRTTDELRATVSSPHFQQALQTFASALATGQLGPVIAQFGLGDAAQQAAQNGDVEGFVKALQESEKSNK